MEAVPDLPIYHTGQATTNSTSSSPTLDRIHRLYITVSMPSWNTRVANRDRPTRPCYNQHWSTITKRDFYLDAAHKHVSISTKRSLCCAPWTNGSLVRDKEKELADECYHTAKSFKAASTAG